MGQFTEAYIIQRRDLGAGRRFAEESDIALARGVTRHALAEPHTFPVSALRGQAFGIIAAGLAREQVLRRGSGGTEGALAVHHVPEVADGVLGVLGARAE